jgi:putative permease
VKKLAWYTLVGLATLAGVFLLWELRTAIILFVLSLIVAAILRPMVDFLTLHRLPRGLALLVTYLAVVLLAAALGLFLLGPVINEFQALVADLPANYEQIQSHWLAGGSLVQRMIAQNFPNLNNLFKTITGDQWNIFIQNMLGMTLGSIDLISKVFITFVLSIYWSADQEHFKRLWLSLLPSDQRTRWKDAWQYFEDEIGSYLRSELIQSLLTVIFLGIGYQLIGLQYPVLLAVFGAVGWLIVWFGGLVVVVPAFLAGLAISPAVGLLAAFYTIAVLSLMEFIVQPRLFHRQRLSSLLVVIMVLIMVKQYGLIGFFIAPPLAAAIPIFTNLFFRPALHAPVTLEPPPNIQIDILRERLNCVQMAVAEKADPPSPEIVNLINRLNELIDQANQQEEFN